jgi:hypothetical protein
VNSGANERERALPNPRSPCAFGSSSPQSEEMSGFRAIHARSVVCLTTCFEPHNGIARGRSCSWDNGEDCLSTFRTLPPQHATLALFISIILTDPAPHAPFVSAISVASPRSQPSTGDWVKTWSVSYGEISKPKVMCSCDVQDLHLTRRGQWIFLSLRARC